MPGYVKKALEKYQHKVPAKPQHAPHKWNKPTYGQRVQYATPEDTTKKLDIKGTKRVQSVSGAFLFYGRAVEPPILPSLNKIRTQ